VIEGIAVHLTDTAGLRDSSDPVEQQGVQRSEEAIATADLVLHVFAADAGWTPADDALAARLPSDRTLRVCNKADLAPAPDGAALAVSALTGAGLHALRVRIGREVTQGAAIPEDGVTVNARHAGCLTRTADALEAASRALNEGLAPEFIAIELRDALRGLDDITGITTNEDVLDALFRRFCIGK
jgi:tRNA modification GTPase